MRHFRRFWADRPISGHQVLILCFVFAFRCIWVKLILHSRHTQTFQMGKNSKKLPFSNQFSHIDPFSGISAHRRLFFTANYKRPRIISCKGWNRTRYDFYPDIDDLVLSNLAWMTIVVVRGKISEGFLKFPTWAELWGLVMIFLEATKVEEGPCILA